MNVSGEFGFGLDSTREDCVIILALSNDSSKFEIKHR